MAVFPFQALCLAVLLFSSLCSIGQSEDYSCQLIPKLTEAIHKHHVQPRVWDDSFAKRIGLEFFKTLDPLRLYFTQKDIDDFISANLGLISNEKTLNGCLFANAGAVLLEKKLNEAVIVIDKNLQTPLNYSSFENIQILDLEKQPFVSNRTELEQRWVTWIKFQTLTRMYKECEIINGRVLSSAELMPFESLARKKVASKEKERVKRILAFSGGIREFASNSLLKSIATSFDPHTNYFTRDEMTSFEASLSTTEFSFGLDLIENQIGEIVVSNVAPGGPAWNSNKVHKGDVLIHFNWENEPKTDLMDFEMEELSQLISSDHGKRAELTLKKRDGSLISVKLSKEKLESKDNHINSFILRGTSTIGYISLPGFYSDWGNTTPKGCANDLAHELIKLKKENIKGLILDLRFNGGGSMEESIDLSGMFIDIGPVVLAKSFEQKILAFKDINRGLIYDGPVIILVNGLSASASEVVSAALQDYNRALVVGSNTYGKATGQIIIPLELGNVGGFLKVTSERLYRITGKSNQCRGVKPDVPLPDLLDIYTTYESEDSRSLPPDSVEKKIAYSPQLPTDIKELNRRSAQRIQNSKLFNELTANRGFFLEAIPLEIKSFTEYIARLSSIRHAFENNQVDVTPAYSVSSNKFDNTLLQIDTYRKELNAQNLTEIEKSMYLDEAYKIMLDYITLLKK